MKLSILFLSLIFIFSTSTLWATTGLVTLTPDYTGLNALETEAARLAFAQIEAEINKDFPQTDASSYTKGMANASVMSGKGVGTDYADDLTLMVVGAGVGIGADLGDNSLGDLIGGDVDGNQIKGIGFQGGILAGINGSILPINRIGFFDFSKFDIFLNLFKYDYDKNDPDFSLKAETSSFGIHGRYRIMNGNSILPLKMLRWHGLYFTTGIERTSLTLTLNKVIETGATFSETYLGQTATGNASDVNATIVVDSTTTSIPLEISTSLQYLYIMTTYLGLGTDLNFGEASVTGTGSGSASLTVGAQTPTATLNAMISEKSSPDKLFLRGFVGHQFNISVVKILVQLDKTFGKDLMGVTVGARVAW